VGNSLVVWAAPTISEIESGSKLGLSCAYRYTPVMEPVTYKGQRADGWLRLTRETRYRFAVSQQKCDHLPLEKFDCLARALRFDLTRRRTRLLRRPLRVSFVLRGLGHVQALAPNVSILGKASKSRRLRKTTTLVKQRAEASMGAMDAATEEAARCSPAWLEPPQWRRYAHDNSIVILSRLFRACVISCVESKRMYLRSRSCKARRTRA
jgi:hypothetical protein